MPGDVDLQAGIDDLPCGLLTRYRVLLKLMSPLSAMTVAATMKAGCRYVLGHVRR